MKWRRKKRPCLALLAGILLLCTLAGGSLAWLTARTAAMDNTFTVGQQSCEIEETFDKKVKTDVKVRNTGDFDAWIRAAVVVNWSDGAGGLAGRRPVEGTDYRIEYGDDWAFGADGYAYCKRATAPGNLTPVWIVRCEPLVDAPEGYALEVTILAETIQSEPLAAVREAWPASPVTGEVVQP